MGWKTAALVAAVIVSNVVGNFVLGWGMKHLPAGMGPVRSLLEPAVLAGIVLLAAWTLLRLRLLGLRDLSWVLPVTSIGYVLNAIMGAVFLGESVSAWRWTGTALIMAGAALVGREESGA